MRYWSKKQCPLLAMGMAIACLLPYRVLSQDVVSPPSGFYRLDLLGNSDTVVSLPFLRPEAYMGLVASYDGSLITVTNSPAWPANQYVYQAGTQSNTYFALFLSGVKEGNYYTVTNNGADTLSVDLNGDSLTGLAANDRLAVVPYWTFGTVFPGGNGIHVSPAAYRRVTEVLMPDLTSVGINLSANKTYYFYQGSWKAIGMGSQNRDDDVLLPDTYFIVRQNTNLTTTLTVQGSLATSKWVIPLGMSSSSKQDHPVSLPRAVGVSLRDSGLIESGAFRPSPFTYSRLDELLTFDNTAIGMNKSPIGTYYYWSSAWRKIGQGATDVGDTLVFEPGTGVIIRKGVGTETAGWTNPPNY
jgi:uncharacterized protein (TIGR02597 family)